MEFREFSNPEGLNYDIESSLENKQVVTKQTVVNPYVESLMELVGLLEDGEWEEYGITECEYMNPTADTIFKVEQCLDTKSNRIR
jgi:hypothetical protein